MIICKSPPLASRPTTTAEQAFTPQNILRAQLYWTTPWPTGIVGANYKNDSDEFGLWVEKANPSRGKAPRGIAVRQAGKYGHGDKFTCVISIMEDGRRWFSISGTAWLIHEWMEEKDPNLQQKLVQTGRNRTDGFLRV